MMRKIICVQLLVGALIIALFAWAPGRIDRILWDLDEPLLWFVSLLALIWAGVSVWLCVAFKQHAVGLAIFASALGITIFQTVREYGYMSIAEHPLLSPATILVVALGMAGGAVIVYKSLTMLWREVRGKHRPTQLQPGFYVR